IMAAALGRDTLPEHWSYGVCRDGRVFFINDETRNTTWLHPRSGEPLSRLGCLQCLLCLRGLLISSLSLLCLFSHNQRSTSFCHPVTGQISSENVDFLLSQGPRMMSRFTAEQLSSTTVSEASTAITSSTVDSTSASKASRSSGKTHNFGKREQSIKRNPNVPVVVRGWLYKQDSSGMRLWKRKWFVLSDFCLFYYKDSREEAVLGSIPLPSYVISPVGPEDHISRKYAFKASHTGMRSYIYKQSSVIGSQAEHTGMRTYYFSTDTQEDMSTWLKAMNQTNHVNHQKMKTVDSETTKAIVHEVLLEPIHRNTEELYSFHQDAGNVTLDRHAGTASLETDKQSPLTSRPPAASALPLSDRASASAPVSRVTSRAPSRSASTLPSSLCTRNGLVSTPSPILEPNGIAAGTYQRAPEPAASDTFKHLQRRNTLEQVEQWVKVQKTDPPSRENTLPRRTPPTQHKYTSMDAFQTLPKTPRHSPPSGRLGEYKYAQDRLSHFRLTPDQGGPGSNTVLQLYEWQQRQQFRHGSPTAPIYTPAPDYPFGPRPPSTVPPSSSLRRSEGSPRCVSVPPSAADIPPPGPPPGTSRTLSPNRRPHTPAERVTVRPAGDGPLSSSPRPTRMSVLQAATIERRSMPPTGYITHTVSAPSLHGKTADDTYMQLKKDLEYLDLKVRKQIDKLERVLDVSHQQMEQYQEQPAHVHKIAYQQRLLQEDLVTIRAQISRVSTEMARAWEEYNRLEQSVELLRLALQAHMQEKAELKRELWRIEDVMGGLSTSKANYKITVDSIQNPDRRLVPSVSDQAVPSGGTEVQPPPRSSISHTLPHSTVPKWVSVLPRPLQTEYTTNLLRAEDDAPPRPPLPRLYDYEETPPVVPPLPKEASVIRHTSVRGLKRQSDERKRDREGGQYIANGDCKVSSFISPEVGSLLHVDTIQLICLLGTTSRLDQSNSISSYVTLRRAPGSADRPKSAFERLSSPTEGGPPLSSQTRGRMTAEEQLERMKRHQRALVRERKRNLSHGERSGGAGPVASGSQRSSSRPGAEGQSDEGLNLVRERETRDSDEWMTVTARRVQEADLEPLDYDLDISRELSKPDKVVIPERYVESDPEEPLSPEELEERGRRAERIKNLLTRSSVQNIQPSASLEFNELDNAMEEQERIMSVSYALASEASRKSKLVAG
uniref:Pleckstrin homology domain containing, family A member 7a n=1 Tax=Poecilia latipinna TaxID=48699 RepID=A0A3B3VTC3_9TELE